MGAGPPGVQAAAVIPEEEDVVAGPLGVRAAVVILEEEEDVVAGPLGLGVQVAAGIPEEEGEDHLMIKVHQSVNLIQKTSDWHII